MRQNVGGHSDDGVDVAADACSHQFAALKRGDARLAGIATRAAHQHPRHDVQSAAGAVDTKAEGIGIAL